MQLFLSTLRADFKLSESYECNSLKTICIPVRAMGGTGDSEADENAVAKWEKLNKLDFKYEMYDGSHFFIKEEHELVLTRSKT